MSDAFMPKCWLKILWNFNQNTTIFILEQLEHQHSEDTPCHPMITHTIGSQAHTIDQFILDPKSKQDKVKIINSKNLAKLEIFEFWQKFYMQHSFWNCLIRCVNTKWIQQVL